MYQDNFLNNIFKEFQVVRLEILKKSQQTGSSCSDFICRLGCAERYSEYVKELEKSIPSGTSLESLAIILCLSQCFLVLSGAPLFDTARVVSANSLQDARSGLQVDVAVEKTTAIPQLAYQIAFKSAQEIEAWFADKLPTEQDIQNLFGIIQTDVLDPLRTLIPSGRSTIPVLTAAHRQGIPISHLAGGVYQLGWGSKSRRFDRSTTDSDSASGAKLAQNKFLSGQLIQLSALPAPTHFVVSSAQEALSASTKLRLPVVVKPVDRDRGEGVTVDVSTKEELIQAFEKARKLSKSGEVLVEQQVHGICHRFFISRGNLLYCVRRMPMSILGDGIHTIQELVSIRVEEEQRKPPWERSSLPSIDEEALTVMSKAGIYPDAVPGKGEWIALRRIESTESGGIDEDMSTTAHPENVRVAIEAAKLFGLDVAGVDIISPDIRLPWYENGAIINEVNFAPLLGGGDISKRQIPQFLAAFINGDGKIPIEKFDSEAEALHAQHERLKAGQRCFFTSASKTFDYKDQEIVMPSIELKHRMRALVLRSDVDAIVFVS